MISLENQKLSGEIPSELAKLQSLSIMSLGMLHNMNSSETIDLCIDLTRVLFLGVSFLLLGNNSLKGTISTELGALSNLSSFDIGKN